MVSDGLNGNIRVKNAQKVREYNPNSTPRIGMGLVITWEGKPANVDGAAIIPRIGVVVVPKRRRDFGRNTPLIS